MTQTPLMIGSCTFDAETRVVRREGSEHHLEPKHAAVLAMLASEPGRVWTKREIVDAIWSDVCVTDEVLTNAIYQLRRALGDSAREQRFIETIPKTGYRLVALSPAPTEARTRSRRPLIVVAAAAVIAVALVALGAIRAIADARQRDQMLARAESALGSANRSTQLESLRLFDGAARLRPDSARAWSGLAAARWAAVSAGDLSAEVGLPLVEEAARKAIALDPALSRPWLHLGLTHARRWEWTPAEEAFARAIALDPRSGAARSRYAEFLLLTGKRAEARRQIDVAMRLEPRSRVVLHTAGFILTMTRETESAADAYRTLLRIDAGDERAREQLLKLEHRGKVADAELTAARIDQLLRKRRIGPAIVAGMFAEIGEDEKAMEWLQRARREKDPALLLVRLDDRWTRLHAHESFQSIMNGVIGP